MAKAAPSPDASLTQDDSFTETSAAGLTYPWGHRTPAMGEVIPVAAGVGWARLKMPGSLAHINTWLLDDEDGLAIVDTGMMMEECSASWKALFAGPLADTRISRVFGTHLHPDHIGLAGWLCKKHDVPLWMTRGEFLTARTLTIEPGDTVPAEIEASHIESGWEAEWVEQQRASGWGKFRKVMFPLPRGFRRIRDGETLTFGQHDWRVVVGSGHSPEHACLLNEREGVLIAGDQVLPRISSNVSVNVIEPDGDPLGEWLVSIDRLLHLPDDLLVCPAHGEPFRGLHVRLCALRDEHLGRLDRLSAFLEQPRRVVDCFGQLFNRAITSDNRDMATGEALAHLRRLERSGRARSSLDKGVRWYEAVSG